jgi:hypothetical protein
MSRKRNIPIADRVKEIEDTLNKLLASPESVEIKNEVIKGITDQLTPWFQAQQKNIEKHETETISHLEEMMTTAKNELSDLFAVAAVEPHIKKYKEEHSEITTYLDGQAMCIYNIEELRLYLSSVKLDAKSIGKEISSADKIVTQLDKYKTKLDTSKEDFIKQHKGPADIDKLLDAYTTKLSEEISKVVRRRQHWYMVRDLYSEHKSEQGWKHSIWKSFINNKLSVLLVICSLALGAAQLHNSYYSNNKHIHIEP